MFRGELHEMLTRLSSANLLNACPRGLTQNQSESIKNIIWSKCLKRVFRVHSNFKKKIPWHSQVFNDTIWQNRMTFLYNYIFFSGRQSTNYNNGPNNWINFITQSRHESDLERKPWKTSRPRKATGGSGGAVTTIKNNKK